MRVHKSFRLASLGVLGLIFGNPQPMAAPPAVLNTNLQIRLLLSTTNSSGTHSIRIAKDPRDHQLYYLKFNGDVYRLDLGSGTNAATSTRVYSAADHDLNDSVQGFAIGPDGTMYLVGNTMTNSANETFARIMRGVPDGSGGRSWSLLAQTEPYARSRTAFDHVFNGIVVSPDGQYIYVNSGSRTDHGEEQTLGGLYPGLREAGLTAKILRLPASGSNLFLPNDLTALLTAGYVFAQGTRNSFCLAFAPNGDLFGTENGPDRDMPDSLNWLRAGLHYGFPWRMGGTDNPQQFPNYDPSTDRLLDPRFIAVVKGYYHNDPTFPPPPTNFANPVINVGPDADRYRDPSDGSIRRASSAGQRLSTFTAHRSPLGLVFDAAGALAPPFQKHAFMLSWTAGDANGDALEGPFQDASQDLMDLELTKLGDTNYQARVTRIVGGFSNPIDAAIISNRVYVIEYGGDQGVWEVTFPPSAAPPPSPIVLSAPMRLPDGSFRFGVSAFPAQNYQIWASTNLLDWLLLGSQLPTNSQFQFTDPAATNYSQRFYRVGRP